MKLFKILPLMVLFVSPSAAWADGSDSIAKLPEGAAIRLGQEDIKLEPNKGFLVFHRGKLYRDFIPEGELVQSEPECHLIMKALSPLRRVFRGAARGEPRRGFAVSAVEESFRTLTPGAAIGLPEAKIHFESDKTVRDMRCYIRENRSVKKPITIDEVRGALGNHLEISVDQPMEEEAKAAVRLTDILAALSGGQDNRAVSAVNREKNLAEGRSPAVDRVQAVAGSTEDSI